MRRFARPLGIVAAIFMAALTVGALGFFDYNEAKQHDSIGQTPYAIKVEITNSGRPCDSSFVSSLNNICDAFDVSMVKKYASMVDGMQTTVYSGCFRWDSFPVDTLRLSNGTVPTQVGDYMASFDYGTGHRAGTITDLMSDNAVLVQWLASDESSDSADGIYIITSTKPFDSTSLVEELATQVGQTSADLTTVHTISTVGTGFLMPLGFMSAAVLLVCFVLVVIATPLSRAKKIGVQESLGWSPGAIWWDETSCIPLWSICSTIALDIAMLCTVHDFGGYLPRILVCQTVGLGILLAVSCIIFLVVSRFTAASLVRGSLGLRGLQLFSWIAKAGAVAIMVWFVWMVAPSFDVEAITWFDQAPWRQNGWYTVFAQKDDTAQSLQAISSSDGEYSQQFADLYDVLNDEYGGVWARANEASSESNPFGASFATMEVNPNYLARYPLYDQQGNVIQVSEDQQEPVVLIPQSKAAQESDILDYEVNYYQSMGDAEKSEYGSDPHDYSSVTAEDIVCMTYVDDHALFSFSKSVGQGHGYAVESPVIQVLTKANASRMLTSDIEVMGSNAPMKLPLDDVGKQRLSQQLAHGELAGENIRLDTLENAFLGETQQTEGAFVLLLAACGILVFVSALSSALLSRVLVLSRGNLMAVQMLLGWSFIDRHRTPIVVELAVFVFLVIAVALGTGSLIALVICTTSLLIDLLVQMIVFRSFERKGTLSLVKGGYLGA
ncbi:MAG: hypothetical protein ACI4B6_04150 [Atopobiaceae bacterium]